MNLVLRFLIVLFWIFVLIVPFSLFGSKDQIFYLLARFFALFALSAFCFQIFLGAFMPELTRAFKFNTYLFHLWIGRLVYGVILIHIFLIFLSRRLYFPPNLLPNERFSIILATFAFIFLSLAISAALLRQKFGSVWQKIHWLNYLAFVLIFIKSIMIGSDIILFQIKIL
ncbi:hypothetical protein A2Z23_02865, partial [Candidatus Curtissbacteria bacterium RBG_16_39_7]